MYFSLNKTYCLVSTRCDSECEA